MSSLGKGFTALQHRNYRLFWYGQLISVIGTWMQTVAQSWLVLQLTGSAVDLGIVNALQQLPILLIGVFGGVYADRLPKRGLIVITQTVQMLLAFILGVLVSTGAVQIWHIYILAGLLGLANAFDMPTRQAFVMEMVGRDDLMNAIALNSTQWNMARVIGPALAGISIAVIGVTGSFYANGVTFVFVIGGLLLMRSREFYALEPGPKVSVRSSLAEGFDYMRRTPVALLITSLVGVLALTALNYQVLVPLFAKNILHAGPQGFGLLMAAMGIGSLTAGIAAAFAQRPRWKVMIGGAIAMCLIQVCFAFSRSFPLSFVLLAFCGASMISFFTAANTGVQQKVPDRLRGRVMGVYSAVNMGVMPFGNLAAGALAAAYGAPFAMASGALVGLVGVGASSGWLFIHRNRPELRVAEALHQAISAARPASTIGPGGGSREPATAVSRRTG